jgi:hypothetical protein
VGTSPGWRAAKTRQLEPGWRKLYLQPACAQPIPQTVIAAIKRIHRSGSDGRAATGSPGTRRKSW